MKKYIKNLLFGKSLPNEYICINYDQIKPSCNVTVNDMKGNFIADVSDNHLFLGYKPVVFAFPKNTSPEKNIVLKFFANKIFCGSIVLEIFYTENNNLVFYTGKSSTHQLLNPGAIFFRKLKEKISKHAIDSLYPDKGVYDQIRVAYSFPRMIKLIVTGSGNKYNVFPTDLSGMDGKNKYIISLRERGKAFEQVLKSRKIIVCTMPVESYKDVYHLGKNHMQELKSQEELKVLSVNRSAVLNLPLPVNCISYIELELRDVLQTGIHKQLLFEIINSHKFSDIQNPLAHIHEYFALWRARNKFNDTFYIRH